MIPVDVGNLISGFSAFFKTSLNIWNFMVHVLLKRLATYSIYISPYINPYICCLPETHLKPKDTYRLKVKGWKKIFHAQGDQKKAGVAIIPDKIDFEDFKKRQRTLHNDQRINPRRRYNNYKYVHPT